MLSILVNTLANIHIETKHQRYPDNIQRQCSVCFDMSLKLYTTNPYMAISVFFEVDILLKLGFECEQVQDPPQSA